MTSAPLPEFHGIVPPLITPLKNTDTLDVAGLERMLERIIAGGVQGVFILGTTGEGPSLSAVLRHELIRRTTQIVRRRIHVLVNLTDTSFAEAQATAQVSAEVGVDALVASPSPYFPVEQWELLTYFRKLARFSPLPLLLYQMPSHVKVSIELATVKALLDEKQIVGIKDSSGSMMYFNELLRLARQHRPDWSVLIGPEQLLGESTLMGGHGAVCGGGNLQPRLFVDIFQAALRRDLDRVHQLNRQVEKTCELIYALGKGAGGFIGSLKLALSCLGMCDNVLAEPLVPLGDDLKSLMLQRLAQIGVTA